ncbi:MAG: hypothetical protein QOK40_1907, partial [Miltoncostaeaceae bacterium]|nr:hypothetical protein [Miltoncostaeaceae bacterium]
MGELRLAETFEDRDDGSVDETKREVAALGDERSRAGVVAGDGIGDLKRPLRNVGEERIEGRRAEATGREPLELDRDRRRNDERFL